MLALPLIAAIVMTIGFVWGMNSLAGRQAFIIGTGVLVVAAGVANSVRGWREDGLLGFLYRNKYPTGTALSSDEDRSTPFAFWLIVVASMAAAAVLIAMRGWPF